MASASLHRVVLVIALMTLMFTLQGCTTKKDEEETSPEADKKGMDELMKEEGEMDELAKKKSSSIQLAEHSRHERTNFLEQRLKKRAKKSFSQTSGSGSIQVADKAHLVSLKNKTEGSLVSLKNKTEGLSLSLPRERGRVCASTLRDAYADMCFLSGGRNPEVQGHTDQYHTRAWSNVFGGFPTNRCFFCGVAGVYKGVAEGTVMISCEDFHLFSACVSQGTKLGQDSVLIRTGGVAELVITWPQRSAGRTMAKLKPVPQTHHGEDFASVVDKQGAVTFVDF